MDDLNYENLQKTDKLLYCQTKSIVCSALKDLPGFEAQMEEWKNLDPNFPIIEMVDNRIIIRNVPDCDCYKNVIKKIYEKHNVKFLQNDVCIIELSKSNCSCGCSESSEKKKSTKQ